PHAPMPRGRAGAWVSGRRGRSQSGVKGAPAAALERLARGLGEAVAVGEDHQLEAVPDAELVEDRRQMVAHRDLADGEALGELSGLEPLAGEGNDLALPLGQAGDPRLFGV